MKRIEAIITDEWMFDDGQETRECIASFQSVVYASYQDYMADLLVLSQNDDFKFALPHETDSHFPRRTAEERQDIIIKKFMHDDAIKSTLKTEALRKRPAALFLIFPSKKPIIKLTGFFILRYTGDATHQTL
ncbi:hypothetical protein QYZ40_26465 [Vibrio parahaemolyticus]|nr:hypothetical protein [Vibrio parahaemolyticus]MDN4727914.1 hypothetical protein [Vibrio parahaemolyticus]MDN4730573.1 hypothetical protein [Vibrio parahaemolyticus]